MAATVVANLANIDLAENAALWSSAALDPDFFVQGSNSAAWYASKNSRSSETVTPAASVAWSTGDHIYFWVASSVAAKAEAKSTGTTTASGLTIRVTLSNAAYREWHVAGSDTYQGDWKCFAMDLGHTGTELYASSGTFSSASNIASVTFYWDLSNSGNIRNVPANMWNDAIRVGTGLTAYGTAFDFADVAAIDEAVANRYGILELIDGVVFCQGRLELGDSAGTNNLSFDSTDEVLVFKNLNGSGSGLVADALYGIDVVGNGTAGTQTFDMGIKVGTGDAASGRNGTIIRAGGADVVWYADLADANITSCTIYGSTFQGAVSTSPVGIGFTGSPTTFEIAGTTFDGCEQIDTRDAVVRNCNILNSVTISTSGALLWDQAEIDIRNSLFANNTNGIEIVTLTANQDFRGLTFSGNTNDVRYEGASDYSVFIYDGTTPSISNAGAGTLTAVTQPVTTLVTVINGSTGLAIQGARVYLVAADATGDLPYDVTLTSITRSGTTATATFPSAHGLAVGDVIEVTGANEEDYNGGWIVATVPSTTTVTYTMNNDPGGSATGTLKATGGIFNETTDVNGQVSDSRSISTDQPVIGRVRRSTTSPLYKSQRINETTIDSADGVSITVPMTLDE